MRKFLKDHIRIHQAGPVPKFYQCDVCGRRVNQKKNLLTHIRRRHGQKVKCEICGKMLRQHYMVWYFLVSLLMSYQMSEISYEKSSNDFMKKCLKHRICSVKNYRIWAFLVRLLHSEFKSIRALNLFDECVKNPENWRQIFTIRCVNII